MTFGALVLTQVLYPLGITPRVSTMQGTAGEAHCTVPLNPSVQQSTARSPHSTLLDFFPSVPVHADVTEESSWGDSINSDPEENHRIYFQNIDGIRHDADEIDLYISSMAQFHVGTFCWADPGLDFSDTSVQRSFNQPVRSPFHIARSAFSSSNLPKDSRRRRSSYQPGGTFE